MPILIYTFIFKASECIYSEQRLLRIVAHVKNKRMHHNDVHIRENIQLSATEMRYYESVFSFSTEIFLVLSEQISVQNATFYAYQVLFRPLLLFHRSEIVHFFSNSMDNIPYNWISNLKIVTELAEFCKIPMNRIQ